MGPLWLFGNDLGGHFTNLGLAGLVLAPALELLLPPLPPMTVAVRKPTAKNAKYMSAAGCEMAFGRMGGSANETELRLLRPIRTNKPRTARTKIVFRNSFIKSGWKVGPATGGVNDRRITGVAIVCNDAR